MLTKDKNFLAGSKENYKLDLGSERVKNGKMINSINTLCACIITPKYVGILPFISSLRSFFSFSFSDVA